MILIRTKGGETQLVRSLDGYDGCTVLQKGIRKPKHGHYRERAGKWAEDPAAKKEADRQTVIRGMDSVQRFDALVAEIDALKKRIAALEA